MFARSLCYIIALGLFISSGPVLADSGAQCTMCTYVLKNSQARISALKNSGVTDDASWIKAMNDTCSKMDGTPKDMCGEIVNAEGKSFTRSIRKNETPEEACQRAGMCLNMH